MAKLLFDEMLKRTVKWCRIFGISSEFLEGRGDSALLEYAKNNNLIFITRDLELSLRCGKAGVKCVFLRSDSIEEQIAQIVMESGEAITFPGKTRCPQCNGELEIVSVEKVKDSLPENVYLHHEKFWLCPGCGKIYWEGGHWKNITRINGSVKGIIECANQKDI